MGVDALRREVLRMTQETSIRNVARKAGITRVGLSKWVRGIYRDPRASTLAALARAYPDLAARMGSLLAAEDEQA